MSTNNNIWAAISAVRGDDSLQPISAAALEKLCPVSHEVREQYAAAEKGKWHNLKVGDLVAGEGIFLCQYEPRDREGNWLGKVFNVFAAPEDLTDAAGQKVYLTFDQAVARVAELQNWHGHDGAFIASDSALFAALRESEIEGKWVIPPCDLLDGHDVTGYDLKIDNLWSCRMTGAFRDTLQKEYVSGTPAFGYWYSSCTEVEGHSKDRIWQGLFKEGMMGGFHLKNNAEISCRPVRFVEVKR